MKTNPCDGHACDHCYICDGLGICCASLLPAQRALLAASAPVQWERLREAIAQEAATTSTLTGLVRREAGAPAAALPVAVRLGLLLPAPVDPFSPDSKKEVHYAAIPRRTAR